MDATNTKGTVPNQIVESVDARRRLLSPGILDSRRSELGQFMTPAQVARLMASMFSRSRSELRLLDPGAGVGSLTAAFVESVCARRSKPTRITAVAYEVDELLLPELHSTMSLCSQICNSFGIEFSFDVRNESYITAVPTSLFNSEFYDCIIMNPPYRKIRSDSAERKVLRGHDIETSNLYTAFMSLALRQLSRDGEIVSITPRSFCNGPYFRSFRSDLLNRVALKRIHVFDSRSSIFRDDKVLQENIIVYATRRKGTPKGVCISSTSREDQIVERFVNYRQVVNEDDPEAFIHINPDERGDVVTQEMSELTCSLPDLEMDVSTGRVVDFRAREFLRNEPDCSTVPLIYPCHLKAGYIAWPKEASRKPNALVECEATSDLLVTKGVYVLVKRFTAKEERRRIVAAVCRSHEVPGEYFGFENHLNYYHSGGSGLSDEIAIGLANFLNSSTVDHFFRLFNGHTQVNATDLRRLRYPTRKQLIQLASAANGTVLTDQDELDSLAGRILFGRLSRFPP